MPLAGTTGLPERPAGGGEGHPEGGADLGEVVRAAAQGGEPLAEARDVGLEGGDEIARAVEAVVGAEGDSVGTQLRQVVRRDEQVALHASRPPRPSGYQPVDLPQAHA